MPGNINKTTRCQPMTGDVMLIDGMYFWTVGQEDGRHQVMWTNILFLLQSVDSHLSRKPVSSAKSAILATGDE